ncbi:TIGR04282 family arsenosugar biosynthesis glycosyltransferase [Trichothermofontia sp.]
MRQTLMIFMRYPQPGRTKTRLIPVLGPEGAAQLYRGLVAQTLAQVAILQREGTIAVELWFTGGTLAAMQAWLGPDLYAYRSQVVGDLGERMAAAFTATFQSGSERAVLIGTDCPDLTAAHLRAALAALAAHDLVLGPAQDGGYYLIGLRQPVPALFTQIPWGTATVAARTLAIAARAGLSVHCLPVLADIDRPEDLRSGLLPGINFFLG